MKPTRLLFISILLSCTFLIASCGGEAKPYTTIHGQLLTKIDTRNNNVHIKGLAPSTLVMVSDYEYRIEDNNMHIKVMLIYYKYGKSKDVDFRKPLPDNIERIFIEDEKNSVMIWEKSQGYGEFDIKDKWEEELLRLYDTKKPGDL